MFNKLREVIRILFGKPCEHQDILLPHVHTWAVFLAPDQMTIRCAMCPEVATTLRIMAWAEARRIGGLELWTRTFGNPNDVPRTQRIPGAFCVPLFAGTEKYFDGAYKGESPADRQAAHSSNLDLYLLDRLTIQAQQRIQLQAEVEEQKSSRQAVDDKQAQIDEHLEAVKRQHDKMLGIAPERKAELDRQLQEANEKDNDE